MMTERQMMVALVAALSQSTASYARHLQDTACGDDCCKRQELRAHDLFLVADELREMVDTRFAADRLLSRLEDKYEPFDYAWQGATYTARVAG